MIRSLLAFTLIALNISADDKKTDTKIEVSSTEQKLLDQTNKIRAANKLKPLTINPLLLKAARAHSANMAKQEKMAHKLDDKNPRNRANDVGYEGEWCGENVAEVKDGPVKHTIEDVMEGWMKSPEHRKNILSEDYTEAGFGLAVSKSGKTYYTQMFGAPFK